MTTDHPPQPPANPSRVGCGLVGLGSIALGIGCAMLAWRGAGQWPGLGETLGSWGHPRAEGTVISNDGRPQGAKPMAYPVVRYEVDGRPFQIVGNGKSPAEFDVGEKVSVSYDPKVPGRGRIVGFQQQYLRPLAILGAAGVLLALGALAMTITFERRPAG